LVGHVLQRADARQAIRGALARRAMLRSIVRNLTEVGVSASALTIAVAAAIGIGTMVASFKSDFVALLEQRLWQGFVVDGIDRAGADGADGADAEIRQMFDGVDAVIDVRGYASRKMLVHGMRVDVTSTRLDDAEAARYGMSRVVAPGLLLNEVGARRMGLGAGDHLDIGRTLEIVHVFKDFGAPTARVIVPREQLGASWPVQRLTVRTRGDTDSLIDTLRERFPTVDVQNLAEVRRIAVEVFDRTFSITRSLTVVAMLVAVFGLYNSLSALQLRRRHENRLLYHLGIGRAAIVRSGVEQSLIIGAAAALLAVPLGLAIAWLLCNEVNPRAFGWTIQFQPAWRDIIVPVAGSICAAGVAGLVPSLQGLPAVTNDAKEALN